MLWHSIGYDPARWDAVAHRLTQTHRLLRIGARGHGASDAPEGHDAMATLAGDVLAVMDPAGIGQAAFCGLSLGGMIGRWLTVHAPGRHDRFVFANAAAALPRNPWNARAQPVRAQG